MNTFLGTGNLGQDPKALNGGGVAFSFASKEYFKKAENEQATENTTWINCVAFGQLASLIIKYVKKGSYVAVEGRYSTKTIDKNGSKQTYTNIVVEKCDFPGAFNRGENATSGQPSASSEPSLNTAELSVQDDLPF